MYYIMQVPGSGYGHRIVDKSVEDSHSGGVVFSDSLCKDSLEIRYCFFVSSFV